MSLSDTPSVEGIPMAPSHEELGFPEFSSNIEERAYALGQFFGVVASEMYDIELSEADIDLIGQTFAASREIDQVLDDPDRDDPVGDFLDTLAVFSGARDPDPNSDVEEHLDYVGGRIEELEIGAREEVAGIVHDVFKFDYMGSMLTDSVAEYARIQIDQADAMTRLMFRILPPEVFEGEKASQMAAAMTEACRILNLRDAWQDLEEDSLDGRTLLEPNARNKAALMLHAAQPLGKLSLNMLLNNPARLVKAAKIMRRYEKDRKSAAGS